MVGVLFAIALWGLSGYLTYAATQSYIAAGAVLTGLGYVSLSTLIRLHYHSADILNKLEDLREGAAFFKDGTEHAHEVLYQRADKIAEDLRDKLMDLRGELKDLNVAVKKLQ